MKLSFKKNFELSKLNIGEVNKIGLINSSQQLIRIAQRNAPYQTGTLKKSIGSEPWHISTGTKSVRVWPRGSVPYAVRREFENYKNPGKKFYMKRTYDAWVRVVIRKAFEEAIDIVSKSMKK